MYLFVIISLSALLSTAPSGPPLHLRLVSKTHSSILLQWDPPHEDLRNGDITHYSLSCNDSHYNSTITTTEYNVTGLSPYTNYACNVTASTSAGEGPPAILHTTTEESGIYDI